MSNMEHLVLEVAALPHVVRAWRRSPIESRETIGVLTDFEHPEGGGKVAKVTISDASDVEAVLSSLRSLFAEEGA